MVEDLPFRIPLNALLFPFLVPLAVQEVLKGIFLRIHPKLVLVKVVANNSGMP